MWNERLMSGVVLGLALSVGFSSYAVSPPLNSVNNGQIVNGGIYQGTTTFENTANTGLWLKKGSFLTGVSTNGTDGGTFIFDAPNQVVRLDGNIDVRGVRDSRGQYLGSSGKVFVDAAYLFQSGNIYASGMNGGLVQFNVGGATIGSTARIEANGVSSSSNLLPSGLLQYPQGGTIAINSKGSVDIQHNAVLEAQGARGYVNIEGGVVNVEGLVQANGSQYDAGTIRLVSTGQSNLAPIQSAIQTAKNNDVFTSTESTNINNKLTNLVTNHDGDIIITAADSVNPRAVLSSGTTILAAERNINNNGWISADGNLSVGGESVVGGVISLNAASTITNTGRISASGAGSNAPAGIIALSYKDGMSNSGSIVATGDHGGLIDFSGPVNPTGTGLASALSFTVNPFGNGTVVAPNPLTTTNHLIGTWDRTRPNEILFGDLEFDGIIFLNTHLPGSSITNGSLSTWIANGKIRNIYDELGTGGAKSDLSDYYSHTPNENPIIVSSNDGSSLDLNSSGFFANPTSLTVLTNGPVTVSSPIQLGFNNVQTGSFPGVSDFADSIRGQLSIISNSLTIQPTAVFSIFGQTDYLFQHNQPNAGAPFDKIYQALDMGSGSADIATKTSFTGPNSQFNFVGGQDPSLMIKVQNP